MTDRPMLFNAPMVRALLDGTKTQTRRILKPQPITFDIDGRPCDVGCILVDGETVPRIWLGRERSGVLTSQNTRFAVGDRLWVKETWRSTESWDDHAPSKIPVGWAPIEYLATTDWMFYGKTRPSLFMPRWVSRLTLTVTDVRVERLQDISEADAQAEGVERIDYQGAQAWKSYETYPDGSRHPHSSVPNRLARMSYRELWNSINGAGAWEQNPWVVALTFDVHKGNKENQNDRRTNATVEIREKGL